MAVFKNYGKRDKDLVIFNNYKYNFNSNNVNTCEIHWLCVKRSCFATLYTFGYFPKCLENKEYRLQFWHFRTIRFWRFCTIRLIFLSYFGAYVFHRLK
jgi:hypothetical protein